MQYRRNLQAGGTYFLTLVTHLRAHVFVNEATVALLRGSMAKVRTRHPFDIQAAVILPDHIHFITVLPPGDADYPLRIREIKSNFTRKYRQAITVPSALKIGGKKAVWQGRYWEHTIRDDQDYQRHVEYIHYNPVKHGHARRPIDWPWSSFHEYVKKGVYPAIWAEYEGPDLPASIGGE